MIVSLSFTDISTCFFLPFAHHIMANRHTKNDFGLYIQNLEVFSNKKKKKSWMFFFWKYRTESMRQHANQWDFSIKIYANNFHRLLDNFDLFGFSVNNKEDNTLAVRIYVRYTISINIDWIMGNNCPIFCKYFSVLFQLPFQTNRNLWLLNFVLQRKFDEFFEVSQIYKKKELPAFKLENRQIFPYK